MDVEERYRVEGGERGKVLEEGNSVIAERKTRLELEKVENELGDGFYVVFFFVQRNENTVRRNNEL